MIDRWRWVLAGPAKTQLSRNHCIPANAPAADGRQQMSVTGFCMAARR
jgi:hypothetical protein